MYSGLRPTTSSRSRTLRRRSPLGATSGWMSERLADDVADRHAGVERGVGVLEDHLDVAPHRLQRPAGQPGDVLALVADLARGGPLQVHQHPGHRRLAAAGLADDAQRLAPVQVEGDAVDRLDGADLPPEQDALGEREVLDQAADLQDRLGRPLVRRPALRRGPRRHPRAPSRSPRHSCQKWQALARPGSTSYSGGTSVRQTSRAIGQRGLKAQPGGMRCRFGGRPLIAYSSWPFWSSRGIDSQQALGVRVGGRRVDVVHRGGLHDPARVHHRDLVGDVGDHPEVVGDQDQAHVELALQLREQVHHLGLHGDVQRGGGLVGDDQRRAPGRCAIAIMTRCRMPPENWCG